jgi:hypothetical protein
MHAQAHLVCAVLLLGSFPSCVVVAAEYLHAVRIVSVGVLLACSAACMVFYARQ